MFSFLVDYIVYIVTIIYYGYTLSIYIKCLKLDKYNKLLSNNKLIRIYLFIYFIIAHKKEAKWILI